MIDSGGLDEVRRHAEPLREYVDAINATDNTAAHAHASNVAIAIALDAARRRAGAAGRLPRQEPARAAGRHPRRGAARRRQRRCLTGDDVTAGDEPEARRVFDVDGPQLVAIAEGLRGGHDARPAARSTRRPTSSSAPSRTPARRRSPTGRSGPPRRSPPARASCSSRSRTAPTSSRRSSRRARALGVDRALRDPADDLPRQRRPRAALHGRAGAGHLRARRHDRAGRAARPTPGEEAYQLGLEQARHALSLPGVAGHPPDQLPPRQRDPAALRRPRPVRRRPHAGAPRGGVVTTLRCAASAAASP